jgi:Bax protein
MRIATPAGISVLAAAVVALLVLLAVRPEPVPDFRDYEAGPERKAEFFDFMQPLVEEANDEVLADRRRLEGLAGEEELGWLDRRWLATLAEDYAVDDEELEDTELVQELLQRVDAVPVSLALAQAAKESGWGTSRFARNGNNLFGEWCYDPGCGLVPAARAEGRSHEVEDFSSALHSVESYVRNLNTHWGYEEFRRQRKQLRDSDLPLTGLALVDALAKYSERRGDYVEEIRQLIHFNDLPARILAGSDSDR